MLMRLPSRALLLSRYRLTLVAGVVMVVFGVTSSATADPHAVFYTTIGQQQLFFNVLAALDQADYVESQQLRNELVSTRETAGVIPEPKDSVIGSTRSNLASVLTRSVTLEGDDLWTAHLTEQFALESARRRNTDEYIRILCERGFGREGCENDAQGEEAEERKKDAFVVDTIERNVLGLRTAIDGTVDSSKNVASPDQQARKKIAEAAEGSADKQQRPFDEFIAEFEERNSNDDNKQLAVARLRAGTKAVYAPSRVRATALDDIAFDATNSAVLPPKQGEDSPSYINRYMSKVTNLLSLSNQFLSSSRNGAAVVQATQEAEESEGALADSTIIAPLDQERGIYTNITSKIDVPAYAKAAGTKVAIDAVASTEQNLAYAPPQAESVIGQEQLVERGQGQPPGQAAGATTNQEQVLGIVDVDPEFDPEHNQNLAKQLAPGTNPAGFHHEQGPAHLLKALGYQDDRGGCGCSLEETVSTNGQNILQKMEEARNAILQQLEQLRNIPGPA